MSHNSIPINSQIEEILIVTGLQEEVIEIILGDDEQLHIDLYEVGPKGEKGETGNVGTKTNYDAVVAPTATDDDAVGYEVGSGWVDIVKDTIYACVDASTGAAIWLALAMPAQNYIDFDTVSGAPAYKEGRLFYDPVNKALAVYNDEAQSTLQIGQEMWLRVKNTSGGIILNGKVSYINGFDTVPTIALAQSNSAATSVATMGLATHDIEDGTIGYITRMGTVRDVDTSSYSSGQVLFLSDTTPGSITAVPPTSPSWLVRLGAATKIDGSTGTIEVQIDIGSNTGDVIKIFNGAILEDHTVMVSSDGVTVSLTVDNRDSGQPLSLFFDGDFTQIATPITIPVTSGTDSAPAINYVYIPKSTVVPTTSGVGFPLNEQYVPIARMVVQSPVNVQNDTVYMLHAYTDHLADANDQGHLSHIGAWIRAQHSTYRSGIVSSTVPAVGGGTSATCDMSVTAGVVLQLHDHTVPAWDTALGNHIHYANHPTTPYLGVDNLEVLVDANGDDLSGSRYNIVIWQTVCEDSEIPKIFANLPNGNYNSDDEAMADPNRTAITTIPDEYRGASILVARITLRHRTPTGGTYEVLQVEALTGITPGSAAGGGTGGAAGVQNNYSATADPLVSDDDAAGYSVGSHWVNVNSNEVFFCVDNSTGAAIWFNISKASHIHNDTTFLRPTLRGIKELTNAPSFVGSAGTYTVDLDCAEYNVFVLDLPDEAGTTTVSFTNMPSDAFGVSIYVTQGATTAGMAIVWNGVDLGTTAPTQVTTIDAQEVWTFSRPNATFPLMGVKVWEG